MMEISEDRPTKIFAFNALDAERLEPLCLAMLTGNERDKLAPLSPLVRRERVASRGILRILLGMELDIDPKKIQIRVTGNGKPHAPSLEGIDFNVSHSEECLAIAISNGGPVGIDLERCTRFPEMKELAEAHFTPRERNAVGDDFFSLWTLKEALLKGVGVGLEGLDDSRFELFPMDIPHHTFRSPCGWYAQPLNLFPGYRAAIACSSLHQLSNISIHYGLPSLQRELKHRQL